MTPRVDIRYVPLGSDRANVLQAFRRGDRRRLLVCGRDLDDIRGVIHRRDLFTRPRDPIKSLIRRTPFVPEQINLVQLLRHFRAERITMAVVVDEYGGTVGLVTVQDVVQWIVGDLPDTEGQRRSAAAERLDDVTYRLPGHAGVRDWAGRFGVREIDRNVDTVAGLILSKLGRVPKPGDAVYIRNLSLTVESVKQRRIDRVLLRLDASAAEPGGVR
jgi:CBS domain containing-hemolysin-like protein